MRIPRFRVAGLMGLVVLTALAFASWKVANFLTAGILLVLTLATLALALLAAVVGRGDCRAYRLGFAMFGWGYMAVVSGTWWSGGANPSSLATTMALDAAFASRQPPEDAGSSDWWPRVPDKNTLATLAKLDLPVEIPFGQSTSLEDAIKYIRAATVDARLSSGLPIYIDPVGLQDAGASMSSPVRLQLGNVPLRVSLRLLLRQVGLGYRVKDGLISISDVGSIGEDDQDAFRRIGQCWWAFLAAVLGGVAGRTLDAGRRAASSVRPGATGSYSNP